MTDPRPPKTRFVILEHHWQTTHWDLLLEAGPAMRTWSLTAPPDSAGPIAAVPKPDHRLEFLDYEGPISAGRGRVSQWDRGEFEWLEQGEGRLRVQLAGQRLSGECTLEAGEGGWTFRYTPG